MCNYGDDSFIQCGSGGASVWEEGYWIQQTGDGGYIIAGRMFSFGAEKGDVYLLPMCKGQASQ
jgi:hypothetical protein